MADRKTSRKTPRKKVTFSVQAAGAHQVFLMGDFNNWDPKTHPMKKSGGGIWNKTVMLQPGKYEYKFLIDGEWQEDPQNGRACKNCYGTINSILDLSGS